MVLAGVCGVAPPGRESGPTEGVISCGHFAVSGAAVGDRPGGLDQGRIDQGGTGDRRCPVRVLPCVDRHGGRHPEIPELHSGHDQLDPVLRGPLRRAMPKGSDEGRRTLMASAGTGPVKRSGPGGGSIL